MISALNMQQLRLKKKNVTLVVHNMLREPEVLYLPEVIWIHMGMVCRQSSEDLLADQTFPVR